MLAEDDASILAEIPAVFVDEAWGDDESYESKGRAMLEAYLKGDVDGFCIALTGWSFENILKRAGAIEDYAACNGEWIHLLAPGGYWSAKGVDAERRMTW